MKLKKNKNQKEEKIMSEIRKKTSDIQVPDSLSPENMMRKIKQSEAAGKKTEKSKNTKYNFRMIFAGAAVVFCIAMSVLLVNSNILFNGNTEKGSKSKNSVLVNQNFDKDLNESDSGIEKISKKEVLEIFRRQLMKHYVNEYLYEDKYNETDIIYNSSSNEAVLDGAGKEESGEIAKGETANDTAAEVMQENDISEEYYKNNDQVEGIIEGDIVITDGKNIYSTSNKSDIINIIKTDNGNVEKMCDINYREGLFDDLEYSHIEIEDKKIYINNDKLILVLNVNMYSPDENYDENSNSIIYEGVFVPTLYKSMVYVVEYDVSDIKSPKYMGKATVEGYEVSSRMAGNYMYLIAEKSNYYPYYYNMMKNFEYSDNNVIPHINGKEIDEDRIYVCSEREDANAIQVLCAMDINDSLKITDECSALVDGADVYMSDSNIYVMASEYCFEEGDSENYGERTVISKYSYSNGKIMPYAKGYINGAILNQFSTDEKNGYLRIVTTLSNSNAVYILDDKLNITGSLEGLAENEHVESVRIMGDRAYFVTFRQTDPVFTVDLSDITKPVVLDELKVTGFSSYLHMWSDNLLLGIGYEATDDGMVTGAKISMFSMTDDKMSEVSKYVLEGDSSYLKDMDMSYKNILAAPEKNLIGLGICENEVVCDDSNSIVYNDYYYYGIYSYENNEIKRILKYYNENINYNKYYDLTYRGLYIGDYLYIITLGEGIQSINLKDMSYVQYLSFN